MASKLASLTGAYGARIATRGASLRPKGLFRGPWARRAGIVLLAAACSGFCLSEARTLGDALMIATEGAAGGALIGWHAKPRRYPGARGRPRRY